MMGWRDGRRCIGIGLRVTGYGLQPVYYVFKVKVPTPGYRMRYDGVSDENSVQYDDGYFEL